MGGNKMREVERRYEALWQEHIRPVYGYLKQFLGNAEDAEDALNETFRRAHKGLSSFRGDCSERAWLYQIATNVALRSKSKAKRHDHLSLDAVDDDGALRFEPMANDDPMRQVADCDLADRLLMMLPENQRQAVWMRVGLQMTDDEVAHALGVPSGTVKSWVWRSLAKLKQVGSAK